MWERTDRNELKGVWLRPKNDLKHKNWIEIEIWRETDEMKMYKSIDQQNSTYRPMMNF